MSPSDEAPVLEIESLAFSFRDQRVLDGVDLTLRGGRVVALLGPNGAGKSTLIRCICGRLNADGGDVRVAGRNPGRDASARAAIGLVPQRVALYPHLTVRENLVAFARLAGVERDQVEPGVARTIEACDLESVAERRASRLSGGWRRRANIGCAITHKPRLLILDEPTVGIDPPARREIERLLRRLGDSGIAILVTGHELGQLDRLADDVAFLSGGRVVASGPPSALIDEFFGGRRECRVLLDDAPGDDTVGALRRAGLEARDEDRSEWGGLVDSARAWTLFDDLAEAEGVRELGVRRPGLDTLWTRLYGSASGACA